MAATKKKKPPPPSREALLKEISRLEGELERARAGDRQLIDDVLNTIQDGISILDPGLVIRHVNPVIKEWYRDSLPLEGKKCHLAYHNRKRPCTTCPTLRCLKSGRTEMDIVPGLPGSPAQWLELFSYPMKDPVSGEVTGVVEFVRDITARVRMEETLREEHGQLLSIFNSIDQVIYVADLDTHEILFANRAAEAEIGHPVVGKTCYREFQGLEKPCDFCTNEIIRQLDGQPYYWEYHNPKLDRDYQIIDRVIKWPDGRDVRFELAIDITDRKQAEAERRELEWQVQQAQKLESLGVLAGGIAHDFNNVLMVILGNAELALESVKSYSPARVNLEQIIGSARRAADLCRQMFAYTGKSSFARQPIDLKLLVGEISHLLQASISKKAVLKLQLEEDLPPIEADPSQIRQVVMNLLINASEALEEQSGFIAVSSGAVLCDGEELKRIEFGGDLEPGLYVFFEVADTGTGMGEAVRRRIFEPFFSTKFTGRGLGLAAVLGIVRSHGGGLRIKSEPGKGTTFRVLFPALDAETAASAALGPAASTPGKIGWRGEGTVLLAEDEESLRALGIRVLQRLGLEVIVAADGGEAVELFRKHRKKINLVLLDLTMPDLDGGEALEEIRKIDPSARVVIASGYSEADLAERFAGRGLTGILQKPYSLGRLRGLLSRLLPAREEAEEI